MINKILIQSDDTVMITEETAKKNGRLYVRENSRFST